MSKSVRMAVLAVALSACVATLLWIGGSQVARPPQPHGQHASDQRSEHNGKPKSQEGAAQPSPPHIVQVTPASYLDRYTSYCATKGDKEDEKWRRQFWCEVKLTDVVVAAFTVVAAIATAILIFPSVWQVATARSAAKRQLRAYVSGGLGRFQKTAVGYHLHVTINNYGTTPAFIGTVITYLMDESALPDVPPSDSPGEFMGYVLPPVYDVEKSYPSDAFVWWDGSPGKAVYGRIYYRDIFDRCRSCGFLLRIRRAHGPEAIAGKEAYWQDRNERNLGPAAQGM